MVEIIFNYNQKPVSIQSKLEDLFQSSIDKFIQKVLIDPKSVCYTANGGLINPEKTVESQMSEAEKTIKQINVLVNNIEDDEQDNQPVIVQSKDIICPECKEPCIFTIENSKIKLFNCKNNHTIRNIKFTDFNKTQQLDISKIVCNICKNKNKGHSPNNEFYFCLSCKQNICPLCKSEHEKLNPNHKVQNYEQKNYICPKHIDTFNKYCKNCNLNICFSCSREHAQHEVIEIQDVDIKQTKEKLEEIKSEIQKTNNKINEIIEHLIRFIDKINMYYEINKNILEYYDFEKKNRNYQILESINNININNEMYNKLRNINNYNYILDKIKDIINLEKEMNQDDQDNNISAVKKTTEKINQMTIRYEINNQEKIKLFGEVFVKKNKDNCYLLIPGNKKKEICVNLELSNNIKGNILEIKLIETKPITDMSFLFYKCESLNSIPDMDNWDTKNVTKMNCMFCKCTSLISLVGMCNWDTTNVTDMSCLFKECKSLKYIPDISRWNVANVTDMSYMFNDCCSLERLPELTKWKINKNLKKHKMFEGVNKKIIKSIKTKGCFIY